MMLESGQELSARFVLVRRLGQGGSGTVWLASDLERNCSVALKVLADALMQRPGAIAALELEHSQLARMSHPHILRVDGLHRSAEHVWIAMEHAAGGDLTQFRRRPYWEMLPAVIPVAQALAHAHAAGIVHRDVKPANVLLMADGSSRLADFGIASAIAAAPEALLGGSLYTMSPQQLEGDPAAISDDIYAFGAMLYELLSGYPPFYPSASAQRIRTEKPAQLPSSVPACLAQLVERMLAKSPVERPATMDIVERELKAALSAHKAEAEASAPTSGGAVRIEPPSIRPPLAQGEPLRGEWRRSSGPASSEQQARREGFRRGLGVAIIMLGVAAVLVVFLALPKWVEEPARYAPAASTIDAEPAVETQKKDIDFAALARAKQDAEELRAALDERLQKLRQQAVEVWGGEELRLIDAKLASADNDVKAREYTSALTHLEAIEAPLATLEKRAGEVLTAQLDLGKQALQEGSSGAARDAFQLALKIEPGNSVASLGLKRANSLDEVLALLGAAERLEKDGDARGAIDNFRKALALDAQAPRATEGIARIEARLASDAFASAMAQGFSALANADHASARSAFEAARKIRPNAPEVDQALQQIEQEQRTSVIGTKLDAARALEAQEQWAQALQEYRAVIALDSTVAAANEGVARVAPRAALNEQLELYLTQPERLFSQPVRFAARESLARAQAVKDPGPVLQKQIVTLQGWLARADVPVEVALRSDNLTQVTIYKVGSLGNFEQRSLELAPGRYTVVGTRPGYRDVRRQIDVMPGAALEPIVIRCEDRI